MNSLTVLYQNIFKARESSQNLLGKVHRLAMSGNVDDQKKAVGLGAELTRSLINEKHAIDSYMKALGVSLVANLDQSKAMSRAAFNKLSPRQRMDFFRSGGRVAE